MLFASLPSIFLYIFILFTVSLCAKDLPLSGTHDENLTDTTAICPFCDRQEQDYLKEKGSVRICVDPDWMPFEHINRRGQYEGILADYAVLFSEKIGVPLQLVKTENYAQSLDYLKKGRCDIITGDEATEDEKRLFLTTAPYFTAPRAFVTRDDARLVHAFSQIAHSGKIGVLPNSPAQFLLKKRYPDIELVTVENTDRGLQRVALGELVAFVNILPSLVYSIQKQGLSNVKISGTLPSSVKLSVLVNRDNPLLQTIFDKAIMHITQIEKQRILRKWIEVTYERGVDYALVWKIFIAFALILLAMALRYFHVSHIKRELEVVHRRLEKKMLEEIGKNREQQLLLLRQNRLAQKGEILSMIAHQWRQPLNSLSIILQTFILRVQSKKADERALREFTKEAKQLIRQMSDTIDDFRNFFQTEKQKVHFSLSEVVTRTVAIIQPLLEEEDIEIEVDVPPGMAISGYPNELGQAILNILTNARDALVQSEREKRRISVVARAMNQHIEISICDNGGGIDEAVFADIFDPYVSTKKEKQGTGLGLYMARIIIEEHMGGRLRAFNRKEGACFEIVL